MNIETGKINSNKDIATPTKTSGENTDSTIKFSDELKNLEEQKKTEECKNITVEETKVTDTKNNQQETSEEKYSLPLKTQKNTLENTLEDLSSVVQKINQSDDKENTEIKKDNIFTDNNDMINNDFNIQENKDLLPQMNPNMNFSGDGQPFSSFMNNQEQNDKEEILPASAKDLAEEKEILSTMAENIAIAQTNIAINTDKINDTLNDVEELKIVNKNDALKDVEETKIVNRNDGIKKVDTKTGITVENIVKYDNIIMNEADVEVFANLVENGTVNMNNLAPKSAERGVHVSKTLADMLAKSMENNQPVRIDFDNDISIIIRISRDGKISAEFLPSSQVAEAYLKENLPLLRQRFQDNNIDYESLEQRERKEQNREQNRKKGRDNE